MAKTIEATDTHTAWATMSTRKLVSIFVSGLIVGAVTYSLFFFLERFVFDAVLCRENVALARCASKDEFAAGVALVLGSMLGLVLLVRELVYRPILAIIGVLVSVWGIFSLVAVLPWFVALIIIMVFFGIAYVLYSWLVQPTNLYIALAVVIVASVLARLVISV